MCSIQLVADRQPIEYGSLSHDSRTNASQKLWTLDPLPSGFEYGSYQLMVADVVAAAELQAARNYGDELVANYIGSLVVAADTQLAGFRQGSSLGLIRFVAAASVFNCATFH